MDKLLKEAIADAKAVRETAIANAKLALEEAFTPKLQSMLSAKIREEEEEDVADVADDAAEQEDAVDTAPVADDAAEMADEEEGMGGYGEEEEVPAAEEPAAEVPAEEPAADTDEMADEDEMADAMADAEEDEEAPADDMELEAIIRELEDEMAGEEEEEVPAEEPVAEQSKSSDIGKGDNKVVVADGDDEEKAETETSTGDNMGSEDENMEKVDDLKEGEGEGEDDDEPVDLEEIIRSLSEEDGDDGTPEENPGTPEDDAVNETFKKKLKEAYATIKFMKSKLTEVNLLNAKLLFANKLFRGNNLDEGQKVRVIETFDRAGTVREVKLVYSTLAESLKYDAKTTKRVKKITEGLASKPSKTTKPASKAVISESTQVANRFKKLAGLIK